MKWFAESCKIKWFHSSCIKFHNRTEQDISEMLYKWIVQHMDGWTTEIFFKTSQLIINNIAVCYINSSVLHLHILFLTWWQSLKSITLVQHFEQCKKSTHFNWYGTEDLHSCLYPNKLTETNFMNIVHNNNYEHNYFRNSLHKGFSKMIFWQI